MIIDTVNQWDFVKGFDVMGRGDNFTQSARVELFHYYEVLSDAIGEHIKFDPIAICCDWSEYSKEDVIEEWGESGEEGDTIDDVLYRLEGKTPVLTVEHYGSENTYLI